MSQQETNNKQSALPGSTLAQADVPEVTDTTKARYTTSQHKDARYIQCESSPNIRVHVEYGLTVGAEERKKYPNQTIFLDGAFNGEPFLDNELRQYSFDHHVSSCPRNFLLASCEQTVIMVLEGLPLDNEQWRVYLNDPDLDAVLSAWILLNHAPLRQNNAKILFDAMPLIRVEGIIDAHGTDMAVLSGLPSHLWQRCSQQIDTLRGEEKKLKAAGQWETTDLVEYTRGLLLRLDELLFPSGDLQKLAAVKEVGRVTLAQAKVAILTMSKQGIYAVEERLKARFGEHLALIVLDPGNGHITLRQVNPFLPKNLNDLYPVLNERDTAAAEDNRWGGSNNIGGSPRRTGTKLTGQQILESIETVFGKKRPWWKKIFGVGL